MRVLLIWSAEPASAPVTQWPLRILLVVAMLGVIALVLLAMRAGWLRRARLQSGIPLPAEPPEIVTHAAGAAIDGVFLGTTGHGDWLDRIVVHDLGVRSRARVEVGLEGVAVRRQGARDLLIPLTSLRAAGLGRGIAGKAYERDGVLIITWELGGRLVDTGFRADTAEDQQVLLDHVLGRLADAGLTGEETR
jgi:hypothetical protein